jgi:hypothetical protein
MPLAPMIIDATSPDINFAFIFMQYLLFVFRLLKCSPVRLKASSVPSFLRVNSSGYNLTLMQMCCPSPTFFSGWTKKFYFSGTWDVADDRHRSHHWRLTGGFISEQFTQARTRVKCASAQRRCQYRAP